MACPALNVAALPANIYILFYTDGNNYGSVAVFACSNGLTISEGQPYVHCLSTGIWSTVTASCKGEIGAFKLQTS